MPIAKVIYFVGNDNKIAEKYNRIMIYFLSSAALYLDSTHTKLQS